MKKILILGCTGSIGTQALEIVAASDGLSVVGLAAGSSWEPTLEQAREHGVPAVAFADPDAAEQAKRSVERARCSPARRAIRELIASSGADLVLNGIVGAAGLGPTIVALSEGIDVALANKESLVIGGELVIALAEATDARLLPVDSEHSALFQLIGAEPPGTVERLVLTASGGPFRGRTRPRRGHPRGGARPPDLGHGRADHDRLGDPDEQGLRDDRGPPPLRGALRAHRRRRPPAVDRPLPGPPQRRRLACPPRLPRHAGADLLRPALPRARRRRGAGAGPGGDRRADLRAPRPRRLPLPAAGARGG